MLYRRGNDKKKKVNDLQGFQRILASTRQNTPRPKLLQIKKEPLCGAGEGRQHLVADVLLPTMINY